MIIQKAFDWIHVKIQGAASEASSKNFHLADGKCTCVCHCYFETKSPTSIVWNKFYRIRTFSIYTLFERQQFDVVVGGSVVQVKDASCVKLHFSLLRCLCVVVVGIFHKTKRTHFQYQMFIELIMTLAESGGWLGWPMSADKPKGEHKEDTKRKGKLLFDALAYFRYLIAV